MLLVRRAAAALAIAAISPLVQVADAQQSGRDTVRAEAREESAALARAEAERRFPEYERRFSGLAAQHSAELTDLIRSRGRARSAGLPNATLQGVLNRLDGTPTILLLYAFRGDSLEVWALGGGAVAVGATAASPQELESLHSAFRRSLGVDTLVAARSEIRRRRAGGSAANAGATAALVQRLTDALFPKEVRSLLAEQLRPRGETEVPTVVIVPTHGIGTVPFAALKPFGTEHLLVDHAAIAIAPSLYDIGRLTSDRVPLMASADEDRPAPLVVGNPSLPPQSFDLLPGAAREAAAVAGLLGTVPLLGSEATKDAVLKRIPPRYGSSALALLYFATHGVADPANPLDGSYLALASTDGSSVARLTAREIQGLSLSGALVVLSACQTGLGQAMDAGVVGLARAFQLAGATHVAMSLWDVNDAATADLMEGFMRSVLAQDGELPYRDVPNALRTAMLQARARWPNPADWASFTVFGIDLGEW